MTSKHRSISERLARAKSPEARASVLADWIADWEDAQWHLLEQIETALRDGNYNAGCIAAGAFKNQIEQRFDGLETVLRILQEPHPTPRQKKVHPQSAEVPTEQA